MNIRYIKRCYKIELQLFCALSFMFKSKITIYFSTVLNINKSLVSELQWIFLKRKNVHSLKLNENSSCKHTNRQQKHINQKRFILMHAINRWMLDKFPGAIEKRFIQVSRAYEISQSRALVTATARPYLVILCRKTEDELCR